MESFVVTYFLQAARIGDLNFSLWLAHVSSIGFNVPNNVQSVGDLRRAVWIERVESAIGLGR